MGVFVSLTRPSYEETLKDQIARAKSKRSADLQQLLNGDESWEIG
jgi:hypothetical protein